MLTPVDPPSVVGSAMIAIDLAMEVDKAEMIPVKPVVSFSLVNCQGHCPIPTVLESQRQAVEV